MIIKQELKSVNTGWYEVFNWGYPEKHIRERLIFDSRESAYEYQKQHADIYDKHGGIPWDKNGNSYLTRKIFEEPTWINKDKLRLEFAQKNQVYTICACCGAELHENQKENHMTTKYGIIGPECSKKLLCAGIELK